MNKKAIKGLNHKIDIVEKRLKISPDYQYKALRSSNFIQSNWHANKLYILEKYLNLNRGQRVLDLGTGSGNFEFKFASKVKEIVGVDYNDEALVFLSDRITAKKINNVNLIQSDIRHLSKLRRGKFDVIVLSDVIEHIKMSDAKKMVEEMSKMLKKGGLVSIITPNYQSIWTYLEKFLDKTSLVPKFDQEQHLSQFNLNNLSKIFLKNKFRVKEEFTFNLFSPLIPNKELSFSLCDIERKLLGRSGNLIFALYEFTGKV